MSPAVILGRRVRELRIAAGLTQREFARRLGLASHVTACRLERHGGNLELLTLLRIARVLECTLADLLAPLEAHALHVDRDPVRPGVDQ